ncbi:chemotaxis protein CheD [Paludisphaera soli]|uniref:chemotaxis protein CheD n=1 Tax=Paludisphaera soli TaxID=2712865 RepID=UPI001F0E6117|nr:chemotaxis protein CheD [Paludisphaera soli]
MPLESEAPLVVSVAIGRWAVASPPSRLRTLLGSCVGVVLHDRSAKWGGLAHVVLPDSRGAVDQPGKYADTAIPGLIAEMEQVMRGKSAGRLVAKLAGGASMFQTGPPGAAAAARNIGRMNQEAVEAILDALRIPILSRDLGGEGGRNLHFDPATGRVQIRSPGGAEREM